MSTDRNDPSLDYTLPFQLTKKIHRKFPDILHPERAENSQHGKIVVIRGGGTGIGAVRYPSHEACEKHEPNISTRPLPVSGYVPEQPVSLLLADGKPNSMKQSSHCKSWLKALRSCSQLRLIWQSSVTSRTYSRRSTRCLVGQQTWLLPMLVNYCQISQ